MSEHIIPTRRDQVTPKIVAELLRYNPQTGELFWRERDRKWFVSDKGHKTWNGKWANKQAFTTTDRLGYRQGALFSIGFLAHRVVLAIANSEWPDVVDHIDGNPGNNTLLNLRATTQAENKRNIRMYDRNKSGTHGVRWDEQRSLWVARIGINGKSVHIGRFASKAGAIEARKRAERENGFHKNHGRAA